MYGFLLALLVLDGLFLGVVILLQSGKGGGLAAMGGGAAATEGILGGRQAATVLTRATWTAGSVFMVLSLVLAILSSRAQAPQSILRPDAPTTTAPAPEPLPLGGEQPATPGGTAPTTPDGGAAPAPGGAGTTPGAGGGAGAPPNP
jgi:preprotein translocase subunit SecG